METIQRVLRKNSPELTRASGNCDAPAHDRANLSNRTVAITPGKAQGTEFKEVKRVCQENPVTGLRTMHEAGVNRPFRFIYISGITAERDQTKKPFVMPQYLLMRVSL